MLNFGDVSTSKNEVFYRKYLMKAQQVNAELSVCSEALSDHALGQKPIPTDLVTLFSPASKKKIRQSMGGIYSRYTVLYRNIIERGLERHGFLVQHKGLLVPLGNGPKSSEKNTSITSCPAKIGLSIEQK